MLEFSFERSESYFPLDGSLDQLITPVRKDFTETFKQEEVYCHNGYVTLDSAKASIGYWINY